MSTIDAELLFAAEFLDDVERIRIATENRLRSLTELGADTKPYEQQVDAFKGLYHQAELQLQRTVRRHPLGGWVKTRKGIGEKQGARLLAAIGDPYIKAMQIDRETGEVLEEERPRRGPAELWAYCGYAPGQKRRKGIKSNWNATAKMRAYLCAESCMKNRDSPFRSVYDDARMNWASHDTTDGHKHNHALRLVAKALLKDLWVYARNLAHDQSGGDTHPPAVAGDDFPATTECPIPNVRASPEPLAPDHIAYDSQKEHVGGRT